MFHSTAPHEPPSHLPASSLLASDSPQPQGRSHHRSSSYDDADPSEHNNNNDDDNNNINNNDDHNNHIPSASTSSFFTHFAYPISYTTSAILRRLSEDSAPTPLARALSANFNGLMRENTPAVFNPPSRTHSPFQPPPLTPLTLEGYKESTGHRGRLLSKALAEEIRLLVPPRLQLVDTWRLAYSLEQDGTSLKSLFGRMEGLRGKRGGCVLVVKDGHGGVSLLQSLRSSRAKTPFFCGHQAQQDLRRVFKFTFATHY